MQMIKTLPIGIFTLLLFGSLAFPFSKRVNQMPNGSKFSCSNCHLNAGGGGTRNAYGEDIRNHLDNNGDLVWGAALAGLDSDGDGASNGTELQDPTGSWQSGQAQPGDYNLVTNPGDAGSTPATQLYPDADRTIPQQIYLFQNYPNPFNAGTHICFRLEKPMKVTLRITDLQGSLVAELASAVYPVGEHQFYWDGRDANGQEIASGIYFYELKVAERRIRRKSLLLR